jgi:hypothetical protein
LRAGKPFHYISPKAVQEYRALAPLVRILSFLGYGKSTTIRMMSWIPPVSGLEVGMIWTVAGE